MTSNFLGMCSPPVITEPGQARAEINPKLFLGWRDAPLSALLTEGMNQFAARFGRIVLPDAIERRQRVLPVGLRNLVQLGELTHEPYLIDGEASLFGPTARIRLALRPARPGAAVVMRAEIAASPVGEVPAGAPVQPAGTPDASGAGVWNMRRDPLFAVQEDQRDALAFGFQVCADSPLLQEHFPGFPVAPGSLVLDFVWTEACRRLGHPRLRLRIDDARFTRPVTPGARYTCTLRPVGDTASYRFILAADGNVVVTQGLLNLTPATPVAVAERAAEAVAEVAA